MTSFNSSAYEDWIVPLRQINVSFLQGKAVLLSKIIRFNSGGWKDATSLSCDENNPNQWLLNNTPIVLHDIMCEIDRGEVQSLVFINYYKLIRYILRSL